MFHRCLQGIKQHRYLFISTTSLLIGSGIVYNDGIIGERKNTNVRIRRANTNISAMDSVIVGYEYRLRENASLEKIFKYFSSVVVDGEPYMTPVDLVRAITPGVPPSPNATPLNIPLTDQSSQEELLFTRQEVPEFFKFQGFSNGLINFQLFLVLTTLLAMPHAELPVAYGMCAGNEFKTSKFRGNGLNVHNFDFMMQRNIKIQGQGYEDEHEEGDFVYYLFGDDLKGELSFEKFDQFHQQLRDEVLRLQYYVLSDLSGPNNEPLMSLQGFAASVAALVPSDHRAVILQRAMALRSKPVPSAVIEQENKKREANKSKLLREDACSRHIIVTPDEFSKWIEVLRCLVEMEQAVQLYSYVDGHFSKTNLNRAAHAVAKVKLSRAQIWAIFEIFDPNHTDALKHDDFVRLLMPHSLATDPRIVDEGLGLGSLAECVQKACSKCYRNWIEGTAPKSV